jgi:hypothetical protein
MNKKHSCHYAITCWHISHMTEDFAEIVSPIPIIPLPQEKAVAFHRKLEEIKTSKQIKHD